MKETSATGHKSAATTGSFVKGFHGVRYQVSDVGRAVEFYTSHLGFKLEHQHLPAFAAVSLGELDLLLSGPQASGSRPMPDGEQQESGGWNRIVLHVADLPACIEELKRAGLPFRNEMETGPAGRQIQLEDPDGNAIELFEPAQQKSRSDSERGGHALRSRSPAELPAAKFVIFGSTYLAVDEDDFVHGPAYRRDRLLWNAVLVVKQSDVGIEVAAPFTGVAAFDQFFPQGMLELQQRIIVISVARQDHRMLSHPVSPADDAVQDDIKWSGLRSTGSTSALHILHGADRDLRIIVNPAQGDVEMTKRPHCTGQTMPPTHFTREFMDEPGGVIVGKQSHEKPLIPGLWLGHFP